MMEIFPTLELSKELHATNISTRTIFVDFDQASNSLIQNGQSGSPYDSINKALIDANAGDTIEVTASQQKDYTIDFDNLQSNVPGWGTVKFWEEINQ